MTTTSQQTVVTPEELACLLACSRGQSIDHAAALALVAKGMLEAADSSHALTPAGHHALHVDQPGVVLGIDT